MIVSCLFTTNQTIKSIMKFIVLAASLAVASAVPYAGLVNTGASAVSRHEDGLGNYQFGYNEDHATGGSFRKEAGGPGYMSGSYGLRDADGRVRTVNYVADALGYRASVSTNEPGVDAHQQPSAVSVNGGHLVAPAVLAPAAPVLAHASPVLAHASPVLAHASPLAVAHAAPIATSYSVQTQHASLAAPVLAGYSKVGLLGAHY